VPITLLCDEHFGPDIVNDFARLGAGLQLRAELARQHQPKALDHEQLAFAARRGWTVLTRDGDYRTLHTCWRVLSDWQVAREPARHAGILWVTSGQIKDRQLVPEVVTFLAANRPLGDQVYSLRLTGGVMRWHGFRPFSRYAEPPLSLP
jgi:hypothetical protein